MPKPTVAVFIIASLAIAAFPARAQTPIARTDPMSRIARATQLEQEAIELYSQPTRAAEAARLHTQSALLRRIDDPRAIQSLVMAARLFNYANRPLDARKTMEQAAERALATGDLVGAAHAYVDAAFFADRQHNAYHVNRLGRKAVLLAGSPVLSPEDRAALVKRMRTNESLALLLK